MAQQQIDFGSFPDDPTADAIRTAFQKVQQNFAELYSGAAGQAVYSVNRTPGAGITVNTPVGNVVVTANIACVQVETSTLSIGITANGANNAIYTSSNQILVIDLPAVVDGITDVIAYGNVLANRVTANIDMYTAYFSATGNADVGNLNSANNITGTNLDVVNAVISGNTTFGNIEVLGCVESSLIPCPPDTWTLGNATNNWDNLYTQDIIMGGVPVMAIGYVNPSFGNVYLASNVAVAGTTSGTATTVLTFTFPNSGYYRINTLLIAEVGSPGTNNPISFGVFDNTGTLVPNSEILCTTSGSAGTSQKITGAGVIDIQVNGAYTYTIRAWGTNNPNILTYGGDGRSSVNWLRLDPVASISTTSNVTFGNLTVLYHSSLNTLATTNNANIGGNLNVSGNTIITGNLTVDGNIIYVNVEDLSVEDPIINLQTGPNGANLVSNTDKDVGLALNYYTTGPKKAWMGWDSSNAEISMGTDVTIANEVVSYTTLANVRAGNFIGTIANGTTNIEVFFNGPITFTTQGNANRMEITSANTFVNNDFWANSNVYIKNTGTGPTLVFQDDVGNTIDTFLQYYNPTDSVILTVNGSNVFDSNISNSFFNSPLTANANLFINNVGTGGKITFIDDLATNTDTSISYVNSSDSIVIKVNNVDSIQSNAQGVNVTGNVVISGNLTVDGNITYINTETIAIEDPIINLQTGPNGTAPTSNSGKDVGTALNYFDGAARIAFMGWDVSNVEFGFASRATITNEIVAFDVYGNVRSGNFIGQLANGNSNINILGNSSILMSANGIANLVEITSNTTFVNNPFYANNGVYINNVGTGAYLYWIDDSAPTNDTYMFYDNSLDAVRLFVNGTERFRADPNGANIVTGNLYVNNNITSGGDILVKGCSIDTDCLTFDLVNANATTVQFAGAGTNVWIGANGGKVNVRGNLNLDKSINFNDANGSNLDTSVYYTNAGPEALVVALNNSSKMQVENGQIVLFGNVVVQNGNIDTTQTTINIANANSTTIQFGGAASNIYIGNNTGTATIRNPIIVGTETTQNLFNTVATTVNFAGAGSNINIGSSTGNTTVKHNLIVNGNITVDQDFVVNGCDFTTNCTTFNLINANATTVQFAGAGTNVWIGANGGKVNVRGNLNLDKSINFNDANGSNLDTSIYYTNAGPEALVVALNNTSKVQVENGQVVLFGNVVVQNGNIDTTQTTINIANANSTTIQFGGAATNVFIGNNTGTATIRNPIIVGTETTQNLFNTVATTVNFAGAGSNINIGASTGNTTIKHNLIVNGNFTVDQDFVVNGCDFTTNCTTFNLINANATTVQFAGAGTNVWIGANGGKVNVRGNLNLDKSINFNDANGSNTDTSVYYTNAGPEALVVALNNSSKMQVENGQIVLFGNVVVQNGNVDTTQTTINIANANSTTIQFGGSASNIFIGNNTGTATLRNPTLVGTETTQNLYNTVATTINFGGTASNLNIGNTTGTATLRNPTLVGTETTQNLYNTIATTVNFAGAGSNINIGANTGTLTLRNPTIVGTETTQNLFNTVATTVNFAGVGTNVNIGNTSGNTTVHNNLIVRGNNISVTSTTMDIANANATTINFAGAGTNVNIGSTTGNTTIKNNLVVDGNLNIDGCAITTECTTFDLIITNVATLSFAEAATDIQMAALTGNTNIRNTLDVWANLNIDGDALTVSKTTFSLANTFATTLNFAGAATTLNIGAATGNTNVKNNLDVDGNLNVDSQNLTTSNTTFNIANTNATTIQFGGAATQMAIGANASTINFRGNIVVDKAINFIDANGSNADTSIYYTNAGPEALVVALNNTSKMQIENANIVLYGNIIANAGNIDVTSTTFLLANANATTINFGGAATEIAMGAPSGSNTRIQGNIFVGTDGLEFIDSSYLTMVGTLGVVLGKGNTNATANGIVVVDGFSSAFRPRHPNVFSLGTSSNRWTTTYTMDIDVSGNINTTNNTLNLANANATIINFGGDASDITIGANGSEVALRGNLLIDKRLSFTDQTGNTIDSSIFYQSGPTEAIILALNNNNKIQIENNQIYTFGNIIANSGNFDVTNTTFLLANANATTINFGGAATNVVIGASTGNTNFKHNLIVDGDTLAISNANFILANANATTIQFGGAANNVFIGAPGSNTTLRGNIIVDKAINFVDSNGANTDTKLYYTSDSLALMLNGQNKLEIFNGNILISNVANFDVNANNTNFPGNLVIGNGNLIISSNGEIYSNGLCLFNLPGNVQIGGNIAINGGEFTSNQTTFTFFPANVTTINFGNVATNVNIGTTTGNTTIKNNLVVDGDAQFNGCDITTNCTTFNLINANATTVYFAGAGTNVFIGAATGTTNVKNNLDVDGNLNIDSQNLTTSNTTFNIANANATTIQFGGAASNIAIGATGSNVNFRGNITVDKSLTFTDANGANSDTSIYYTSAGDEAIVMALNNTSKVQINNGQTVIFGNAVIANGNIDVTSTTINLANANATTINFAGAGTNVNIGASTGNTNIKNNLVTSANIFLDKILTFNGLTTTGNNITYQESPQSLIFKLGGVNKFEVNTTNITALGNIDFTGTGLNTSNATVNIANSTTTTINIGGSATEIRMGASSGSNTRIQGNIYVGTDGVAFSDSSYLTMTGTLGVVLGKGNTNATANGIVVVDGFSSAFRPRHPNVFSLGVSSNRWTTLYTMDIDASGNINTTNTTLNLANANATTIRLGGAATEIAIGSSSGSNTRIQGNLFVGSNVITSKVTGNTASLDFFVDSTTHVVRVEAPRLLSFKNIQTGNIVLTNSNGLIYTSGELFCNNFGTNAIFGGANGLFTCVNLGVVSNVNVNGSLVVVGTITGNGSGLSGIPGSAITSAVANATYATSAGSASYATTAGCANSLCADVAEYYLADDEYERGTVLEYGGNFEVTIANSFDSHRFAGVISTNPAVIMNNGLQGDYTALLALIGRVPVKVIGPVRKGDLMVTAPNGYAIANNIARAGTIIGKALENFDGDQGMVEIVVGRN